jgi:hypothetical protein
VECRILLPYFSVFTALLQIENTAVNAWDTISTRLLLRHFIDACRRMREDQFEMDHGNLTANTYLIVHYDFTSCYTTCDTLPVAFHCSQTDVIDTLRWRNVCFTLTSLHYRVPPHSLLTFDSSTVHNVTRSFKFQPLKPYFLSDEGKDGSLTSKPGLRYAH